MAVTTSPGSINSLKPGDRVEGIYACTRKERKIARNGAPFLTLELSDSTGSVSAQAFRDADFLASRFERGDIVRVAGRVETYAGKTQVAVSAIAKAETSGQLDPDSFLPSAFRDVAELEGFFEHLASEVYSPDYSKLFAALLADGNLRAELRRAPCSQGGHHAYLGGMLEHVVAVATLAQSACDLHRGLDSDLLITAALLHDIGKLREFEYAAEIAVSEQGRLLGHITLGVQLIGELATAAGGINKSRELALLNCILSHHGAPGGRFASAEAEALFHINALDARVHGSVARGEAKRPTQQGNPPDVVRGAPSAGQ